MKSQGELPLEAWEAFSRRAPEASILWLEQLQRIEPVAVHALLDKVPSERLSWIARDFTAQLLHENRNRILHGDET